MTPVNLMNNRYENIRKAGERGEAEVYLARDRKEQNVE